MAAVFQETLRKDTKQRLATRLVELKRVPHTPIRHILRDPYAAGFVERYEIVTTMNVGIGYEIQMRVWVSRNNLAERLLVKSKADGQIDGARAAIAVETSQYSKAQGDRLLYTILKDFPERSFDIKLYPTRVEATPNRGTQVIVPYDISWNKTYVRTLWKAEKALMSCSWSSGCVVGDVATGNLMSQELIC